MNFEHQSGLERLCVALDCAADIAECDGDTRKANAARKNASTVRWLIRDYARINAELSDMRAAFGIMAATRSSGGPASAESVVPDGTATPAVTGRDAVAPANFPPRA